VPFLRRGVDADRLQVLLPRLRGALAALAEPRRADAAVAHEVLAGLVDAAEREAEPQLDGLPRLGRAGPHEAEAAQRRRSDVVEVEPRATRHEATVVPEHLAPVRGVALHVHGERRALDDDLALRDARSDGLQVRAQWDRRAVRDRQSAEREVDHDPGVLVLRERVAVHGALRADGDLRPDAGVECRGIGAGCRLLVDEVPGAVELVERLGHRCHAEVVVVLADRPGARLLEMRESGCQRPIVERRRQALGGEVVASVTRGVGARVCACRDHAERIRRARVRVADLRLRPPPGRSEPRRRRQLGGGGADERVHPLDHPLAPDAAGSVRVTSPIAGTYGLKVAVG
jgi:hypothetical protein